mgnify:CR=1 FL=1
MNPTDHDLLVEIKTHVEYIRKDMTGMKKTVSWLKIENQTRKDWQEDWSTILKTMGGVAALVGGVVAFVGD